MADVRKGFRTIGPLLTNRHAGHADLSHQRGQWQVYHIAVGILHLLLVIQLITPIYRAAGVLKVS